MTQAIARQTEQSLAAQTAQELSLTANYVQLVKNTFAKGASDLELSLFLRTAQRTGLDPAARQLFMVKRYDSQIKDYAMSIQISIDGFRLIADRTGKYAPSREPSYTYDSQNRLESATAYVKKLVGNQWHEIAATAFYTEYVQTTKEGKPNQMWQKMPRLMLAKCAESLVLRKAFPAELSGLYTSDEMGTVEPAETKITDEIRQVQFEIHQEEKGLSAKPKEEEPQIIKELWATCKELNQSGDEVQWTKKATLEYANQLFDSKYKSITDLKDEEKGFLLEDLTIRLNERKAVADEAIEGEVVEETL